MRSGRCCKQLLRCVGSNSVVLNGKIEPPGLDGVVACTLIQAEISIRAPLRVFYDRLQVLDVRD